ncbi:P-loop containing nucleoside triphosphate hydrolase protein, partial [Thamnocephalis sphaerospora]
HIYALALLLSIWLASISTHQLMAASTRVGIQVRSAIMVLIYRKSLRLHSVELAIGDIVNLLADDVNRLAEAYVHRHYLLSSVLEGLVVVALAFVELGLSAFPALALLLLLFPIQYKLGQYIAHNAFAMARRTADRVSAISEILTTLRVIKCYAWEIFFRDRVKAIRAEELRHLRRNLMAKGWTFVVAFVAPVLLTLLCLVMDQHIMGEMNMRATHIFTLLSIFNMIRWVTQPHAAVGSLACRAFSRSQRRRRRRLIHRQPAIPSCAFLWQHNADFIWEGDVNPTVAFLSMTVRAGDVVAVVGDVGAGKSSLLSAIMGQLRHSEGEMRVHGSIAFVPSEPWLVNATLKDNIVFGMPYNEHKYRAVVRACALTRDINSLTRGDETEIGERGANLTMGQRHRVSIARAAYSDAEILLLDDPLSTMDAQIGKRIFNECISGYLRKKAVVIVTNQLQFLEHCDQILIMSDGHCIEQGTYRELVAKDLNLATLIGESIEIEDPYLVDDLVEEIEHNQPIDERDDARRIMHDLQNDDVDLSGRGGNTGSSWISYRLFARRTTGTSAFLAICLFFVFVQGLRIFSGTWTNGACATACMQLTQTFLQATYMVGAFFATQFFYWAMIQKSRSLHKKIFIRILRIPMSYFEYTPIGRILYSFARHQYTVDEVLSEALLQALVYIPLVVSVVVAVIIVVPYSAIVAFVLCMVIWLLNAVALQAERQLRRIEAESKPPIFAHLSATLEGLSSIRVYHSESRFDAANIEKIDTNTKALYAVTQVKGWLSLYVDLVAALFVYATALFILFFRDELEEGPAGLALTNAMQLAMFAQWALTAMREVHDSIGSVEELLRFGHSIPSEAAVTIKGHEPPADWPQHGEIEFEDVVLRYHRFGEPVVKRASFVINARERIGIVGRTGSGKSTLVISLLRLIEAAEGTIRIDGIDIASMGLRDLRSKIAVLPQEPTLFDGTVRSNLDPFEERTDEEIWGALRAAHLAEKIKSMPMRLEAPIIENGKGFSLGQRQLFCVARAILSKCRVLLMDEATSTLDIQTETVIQEAIRKNFANYTVLQIGHRLNTIIDADKIMVLDQGRIVEFDTPRHLLQNPDSFFSSMVLQSG